MATVGDQLTQPENGWRRFDDTHSAIEYIGSNWRVYSNSALYNHSLQYNLSIGHEARFNFTGSKIRIISQMNRDHSEDVSVFIDNIEYNYSAYRDTPLGVAVNQYIVFEVIGLEYSNHNVRIVNNEGKTMTLDAIDIDDSGGIDEYRHLRNKILFSSNSDYKYYDGNQWQSVGSGITEQDYIDYGMSPEDISSIPIHAWQDISNPTISYYTDDPDKTQVLIETETEPFTIYDEFGDEMSVLHYTNDNSRVESKLELTANYSPLDELEGDFDLVAWTDRSETVLTAEYNGIPKAALIVQTNDITPYTKSLKAEVVSELLSSAKGKLVFSTDGGATWNSAVKLPDETYGVLKLEELTLENVKLRGANFEEVSLLSEGFWEELFGSSSVIRFAYYLEEFNIDDVVKINELNFTENLTIDTPSVSNITIIYSEVDARYSGLMFMDMSENYYSTSFGEILRYLDMGTLIAGQTSLDVMVKLTNTNSFDVKNVSLWAEHDIDGLDIQLSKTNNPFISESSLDYEQTLAFGEVIDFYVRLSVHSTANAIAAGNFDIRVRAEQV